jgi:hypothetical protein
LSSILSLLYENSGEAESRENERRGDELLELWKEIGKKRGKNVDDSFNGKAKPVPYQDVVEALTKELKRILSLYEEAEKEQIDNKETKD